MVIERESMLFLIHLHLYYLYFLQYQQQQQKHLNNFEKLSEFYQTLQQTKNNKI